MAASLFVHNDPSLGSGTSSAAASYARRLAQHLLADAPFLSIESTTSDTTTLYDTTLAVAWDETTKIRIYNVSANYFASVIFNGEQVITSPRQLVTNSNSAGTVDTYIVSGTNFLVFFQGTNSVEPSDLNGFFLGQVANIYDTHVSTVLNGRASLYGSNYSWNANGTKYNGGGYVTAFPTPYTNWGGEGHLYAAVPIGFSYKTPAAPIVGFVGGSDSIYTIYDNGNRLVVPCGTTFTIDGHNFFCIVTDTSVSQSSRVLTAIRLS